MSNGIKSEWPQYIHYRHAHSAQCIVHSAQFAFHTLLNLKHHFCEVFSSFFFCLNLLLLLFLLCALLHSFYGSASILLTRGRTIENGLVVIAFFALDFFVDCAFITHLDLSTVQFCYWFFFSVLYNIHTFFSFIFFFCPTLFYSITRFLHYLYGYNSAHCTHIKSEKTAEDVKHKFFTVDFLTLRKTTGTQTDTNGREWAGEKKFENYINICVIWKLCLFCSGNWDTAFFRLEYVPMLCAQLISLFYSLYVTLVFALIFSCWV